MSGNCSKLIETSIGILRPVDIHKTYDEAVRYCEESGAQLASIYDKEIFHQFSSQPDGCLRLAGNFVKNEFWNIGLKFNDGQGRWHDGTIYNSSEHRDLLLEAPKEKGCQIRVHSPVYTYFEPAKLLGINCNETAKFLCLEMDSGINNNNNNQKDTSVRYAFVVLVFVFAIVAFFLFVQYIKKRKVQPPDPRENNTECTEVRNSIYIDDGQAMQFHKIPKPNNSGGGLIVNNQLYASAETILCDDVTIKRRNDGDGVYEQIDDGDDDGESKIISAGSTYIIV